jgi:hypothetical protein
MSATWFTPFFLIFLIYACRGQRQWAVSTIVASFFQAASPILVVAGGRINGLQPAYALLPVGVAQILFESFNLKNAALNRRYITSSHLFIFAMTVIAIAGAFLLPRAFGGLAHVTPPRRQDVIELVHFSAGNGVQAFYIACNFVLFTLISRSVHRGSINVSQCIAAIALGTTIAILLGLYQISCDLLHLPWPDAVINSNLGSAQLFKQNAAGIVHALGIQRRMSATFLEPSMMSVYFLGMFSLFGLGLRRWVIGAGVLFCLIISTSATAIIGLCALMVIWTFWDLPRNGVNIRYIAALCLGSACMAGVLLVYLLSSGNHFAFITDKLASNSGQIRSSLDLIALRTFRESWGLGVGIGSTRSSSFLTTFAASTGIPGMICLIGFFATLLSRTMSSTSSEVRALGLALATILIGWSLSVPDTTLSLIWLLSGIVCGAATHEQYNTTIRHTAAVSIA